jgi:hypothetical protein
MSKPANATLSMYRSGRALRGSALANDPTSELGIARFHDLGGRHAEAPEEVVIGIETDRGLFVIALVTAGYQCLRLSWWSMVVGVTPPMMWVTM